MSTAKSRTASARECAVRALQMAKQGRSPGFYDTVWAMAYAAEYSRQYGRLLPVGPAEESPRAQRMARDRVNIGACKRVANSAVSDLIRSDREGK